MIKIALKVLLLGFSFAGLLAQAAGQMGPTVTLTFETGKAKLTEDSEIKLQSVIEGARKLGTLTDVKIAVWSDHSAPLEGPKLTRVERMLAGQRSHSIQNYLKGLRVYGIETFNMAERSHWLARVLHTETGEVKAELGSRGDKPLFAEELQVIKANGKPSKAVILTVIQSR